VGKEVRALIFRFAAENPTWGAPRIHGELLKLGFHLSEATVSRWLRRILRTPDPAKRWLTFLRNHREAIAAMDFFSVPTLTFGILYCFFVIGPINRHERRSHRLRTLLPGQLNNLSAQQCKNFLGIDLAWRAGRGADRNL
jgi:hypothetical protein